MSNAPLHLHLVSDSTGETVHQIARACLAQFPEVRATEHVWTLVRSDTHVEAVINGVDRNPGIMLMSIVNPDLRALIETRCDERHIPHISVLDPVVNMLGNLLGQPMQSRPGGQRQLDTAYFERMAAVEFAVRHDDGLNMNELGNADILLVGVSRTSKTPTSMYLAHTPLMPIGLALSNAPSQPPRRLSKSGLATLTASSRATPRPTGYLHWRTSLPRSKPQGTVPLARTKSPSKPSGQCPNSPHPYF